MCLAIPVRVSRILDDDRAIIDIDGVQKEISLELVDDVAEGDYVIMHVGYALGRLDPVEAQKTLDLLNAMSPASSKTTAP